MMRARDASCASGGSPSFPLPGRGPTRARPTIRDNVVVVMLEETLTKGEQVLVASGRGENVLALRREYQEAMRDESSQKIAELTGRNVIAMMSDNHLVPDLAVEICVLEGSPPTAKVARQPARSCRGTDISPRCPRQPGDRRHPSGVDLYELDDVLEVTMPDLPETRD